MFDLDSLLLLPHCDLETNEKIIFINHKMIFCVPANAGANSAGFQDAAQWHVRATHPSQLAIQNETETA